MPSLPPEAYEGGGGGGAGAQEIMPSIRRAIQYSGLTYHEVLELPLDVFMLMVKNHYISELNSTQEGRDYLEKCARLNTTEVDRNEVRKFIRRSEA